jgi:hypothetical protein
VRRILRVDDAGELVSARRSPRRAGALELFDRLVSFPSLLAHPNLAIEVPLCREDHVRAPGPTRSRSGRRTRDPGERRLSEVLDTVVLEGPADVAALVPADLGEPFTTRELGAALGCRILLAQRVAYCMRALGVLGDAGKRGRAPLHVRAQRS